MRARARARARVCVCAHARARVRAACVCCVKNVFRCECAPARVGHEAAGSQKGSQGVTMLYSAASFCYPAVDSGDSGISEIPGLEVIEEIEETAEWHMAVVPGSDCHPTPAF